MAYGPGPAYGPASGPAYGPASGAGARPMGGAAPGSWYGQQPSGPAGGGAPEPDTTSGYPLGPPPSYPGGPAWAPPGGPAPPGRPTSRVLTVLVVLVLMGFAALGGGAVGAWSYAQSQDGATNGTAGGTTVVDAPQLDYTSLASIASDVSPSVVQIQAGQGSGSGVVMSEDGHILTNAHVVEAAGGDQVTVRFSNGETASATVVGADPPTDVAVVQVREDVDLTPAGFGDSDEALVGDTVLAIGSPLGFQGSVTQGILSARERTLPVEGGTSLSGLLQTDASINPGNSGGPLVNLAGEVIGINTAIATDGQSSGFLGVGFAVPSNRATEVAEQQIAGEEVSHAFLGVSVNTVDSGGAQIGAIVPDSPAEAAGLEVGDVVVRVDDQAITEDSDLVNAVQTSEPGDTLQVEFERDGARQTTTVTLADADD